jgi:hypothetical protein
MAHPLIQFISNCFIPLVAIAGIAKPFSSNQPLARSVGTVLEIDFPVPPAIRAKPTALRVIEKDESDKCDIIGYGIGTIAPAWAK